MRWLLLGGAVLAVALVWFNWDSTEFWEWAEHQFEEGDKQ